MQARHPEDGDEPAARRRPGQDPGRAEQRRLGRIRRTRAEGRAPTARMTPNSRMRSKSDIDTELRIPRPTMA
jgi:hypothetical protein